MFLVRIKLSTSKPRYWNGIFIQCAVSLHSMKAYDETLVKSSRSGRFIPDSHGIRGRVHSRAGPDVKNKILPPYVTNQNPITNSLISQTIRYQFNYSMFCGFLFKYFFVVLLMSKMFSTLRNPPSLCATPNVEPCRTGCRSLIHSILFVFLKILYFSVCIPTKCYFYFVFHQHDRSIQYVRRVEVLWSILNVRKQIAN